VPAASGASGLQQQYHAPLDWRVLAFTVAVMATRAGIFGVTPAFRATRVAPIDALKHGRDYGDAHARSSLRKTRYKLARGSKDSR
jgi:hypothetical protein